MQKTIDHLPLNETESGLANLDARFNKPTAVGFFLTGFALGVLVMLAATVFFLAI